MRSFRWDKCRFEVSSEGDNAMFCKFSVGLAAFLLVSCPAWAAGPITGTYLEARTCQVYTGPCFANGEVGSAGKDAVMTWKINSGSDKGVDLSGLSVAVVVKTSHTLGFNGFDDAKALEAMIIVDSNATSTQQATLRRFALAQTGIAENKVKAVHSAPIKMDFDKTNLTASVDVGEFAKLKTRKARPGDCICSNESAYYPPLNKLSGFVPGVTIEGDVTARALGTRWSIPDTRTAYLGVFAIDTAKAQLATR